MNPALVVIGIEIEAGAVVSARQTLVATFLLSVRARVSVGAVGVHVLEPVKRGVASGAST